MKKYMVEFKVTGDVTSKEFQELLPSEHERVNELLENGTFENVWFKDDMSGGYNLVAVEDEKELEAVLNSLPLKEFLGFESYQLKSK